MGEDNKLTAGVVGSGRSALEVIAGLNGHLGPLPASDPSTDIVEREPTLSGPHGRAWFVPHEAIWEKFGQQDGQVANWVVEAPWAHPVWHSYWIALVHLRPFPGMVGGTHLYLEGATHELWLYALSPEVPRSKFIVEQAAPAIMTPMNFGAQLRDPGDAAAAKRIEDAVRDIVAGRLNPDTDATSSWAARFGDNMMRDRPGGLQKTFRPGAV